jgi:hypothetical protein
MLRLKVLAQAPFELLVGCGGQGLAADIALDHPHHIAPSKRGEIVRTPLEQGRVDGTRSKQGRVDGTRSKSGGVLRTPEMP